MTEISPHHMFLKRHPGKEYEYYGRYIGAWWIECQCGWVGFEKNSKDQAIKDHADHLEDIRWGLRDISPPPDPSAKLEKERRPGGIL